MNTQVSSSGRPWQALDPAVAAAISPALGAVADEITAAIAEAIPEYRQPMGGAFGRGVRDAIEETLRQFLEQLGRPAAGERPGREVYIALGRGESRAGRGLDALQGAYRVGARIAGGGSRRRRSPRVWTPRRWRCLPSRSSPTSTRSRPSRSRVTPVRRRRAPASARASVRGSARVGRRGARPRRGRSRAPPPPTGRCRARWRRSPPSIATPSASPRSSARARSARGSTGWSAC